MNSGTSNTSPTRYSGSKQSFCTIASRNRAPTSSDIIHPETGKRYPVGFFWIVSANPTTGVEGDLWYLTKFSAGVAYWQLADQGGDPGTITGNDAIPLTPVAGNWNIYGKYSNTFPNAHIVDTTGSGETLYVEDRTSTTPFVVDPTTNIGDRGTFDTIQAAVSEATSGQTIFIKSGIYTEDIELKAGVNIVSYGNSGFTLGNTGSLPNVTIKGKLTFNQEGFTTISGIALQTNGDYALSVTGTNGSRVYLTDCNIIAQDFAAIQISSTGSSTNVRLKNCWCRTNTNATNFFVVTGAGSLTFWDVNVIDGGASTAQTIPSTFASSGSLLVKFSVLRFPISTSGTGRLSATDSEFNTFITNTTPLDISSTAVSLANYIRGCILLSGNTTALTVGAGSSVNMTECSVITTAATPITGTGTILQNGTSYITSNPIPSSTSLILTRQPFDPGKLWGNWSGSAPAAGYVGEVISSFIRDTSAVEIVNSGDIIDITTISLTPGIWDVSGIVMFTGLTTTSRQNGSIGTSSAVIPNISYGDNTASATFTSTTADDVSVTIPVKRQLVTSGTQTMYLIARATWTVKTTAKAYGKITAVRVV